MESIGWEGLDSFAVAGVLSPKEKHMLHIIESNPGIQTRKIVKRVGVSTSTVKRMLERLISLTVVERQGTGPGSYYTLV